MHYSFCDVAESNEYILQAAKILSKTFLDKGNNTWPTVKSGAKEVEECIENPNICIGILEDNKMLGWVGLRPMYERTWELHPLVVNTEKQVKGIGKQLLNRIEEIAKSKGIIGILLGTDDVYEETSLSKVDIDESNIFEEIKGITNIHKHPYEFYQKCGYMICGIVPNANGKRKPDIWMWKDISK